MEEILCHKCEKEKSATEFYAQKTTTRGYRLWCKECFAAWQKERTEEKAKEWKVEKECKICGASFMPRQRNQSMCGEKCLQRSKQDTESYKLRNKDACKKYKHELRERFLQMYGKVCSCCGEKEKSFLTIDHVNSDGHIDRKRLGGGEPYRTLREALKNYNPEKYQVLCFNCNLGRNINGGICPHKLIR